MAIAIFGHDDDRRRLLLLRHAKSSWSDATLADIERPLAPRGRRAGARIGRYLREHDLEPALVLCSAARRARETLALLDLASPVSIEAELYAANAPELLARLRRVPDEFETVMLIGHNPAIAELALALTRVDPQASGLARFPTAGLATLAIAGGWSHLQRAALTAFVRPRELD